MKLSDEQFEFLKDTIKLFDKAIKIGFTITYGEAYRTPEQQEIYFRTGKTKTMNSNHLKRLAIDLNFFKPKENNVLTLTYAKSELQELGDYWESLNPQNKWGGNYSKWYPNSTFVDTPHFERCT
ncbi:MAG TPA: M15 family metallopeptidase [Candidatus Brocadiales bacterium]|nr:M15 family metallopeptidase [Candidatus Brocadiales bacterium]